MIKMNFELPTLYSISSKGKIKEWTVLVRDNGNGTSSIIRRHGYVGDKIQEIEKVVSSGKNIGKTNETTPHEQAVSEALSLRQKRLDTGWSENIPNPETHRVELPMLAQKFTTSKHRIKYPCLVQPKLNGVRCFAKKVDENTIVYTSRKGKDYTTLDHLTPDLLTMMKIGEIFDGEIYIHGESFQHIVRLVKKLRPESSSLQYWVYDIADLNMTNQERLETLYLIFGSFDGFDDEEINNSNVKLTPTYTILEESQVYNWHQNFVYRGFEGVIIRNKEGLYNFDNRSADLQKYKEFQDEEYMIVGGSKSESGNQEGCVIFECVTSGGKRFNVYPKGTLEKRREMYKNLDKYIGKMLTVRYQEKSEDNVPIFPVGIEVRDYE